MPSSVFHAPLRPEDNEARTVGCRHTNPYICSKNDLSYVSAYLRLDGMCLAPPKSWPKQYRRLSEETDPRTRGENLEGGT